MLRNKCSLALLCCSSLLTANSYAAVNGFYLGAQFGWGKVHHRNVTNNDIADGIENALEDAFSGLPITFTATRAHTRDKTGIAGRGFVGYQMNCNWAVELGYSKFRDTKTDIDIRGSVSTIPFTADAEAVIKTHAIDLVFKGMMPMENNFNLYGKAGIAYVWGTAVVDTVLTALGSDYVGVNRSHERKIFPTYGLGVSYDFSPTVVGDVSWNRMHKVGHTEFLGSTDLVSAGISFYFP